MQQLLEHPTVHEALLYEKLPNNKVRCGLCERRCVIAPDQKGHCKTRTNINGKLYTLVYGDLSALENRPIEIKPFFHYWPSSTALTFSTWSCNFDCVWCQNHDLSKTPPNPTKSHYYPPEKIVEMALDTNNNGLCASFQEPTILTDWAVPLFRIGREKRLYCCYVSNGYMTLEVLKLLCESGMDGLKIDVKGDAETYRKYCGGADVEKVWRNAQEAKKNGNSRRNRKSSYHRCQRRRRMPRMGDRKPSKKARPRNPSTLHPILSCLQISQSSNKN